jgi:DNA-binding HxlR family transcriptional regulator
MGDWWTPIVMREAFFGCRRFEQFQERLDISRATLTHRLARLVEEQMLIRVTYQSNPVRYEYKLTEKGISFFDVLAVMWAWGDRWQFDSATGAAVELTNRDTKAPIKPVVIDASTGLPLDVQQVRVRRKRS